MGWRRRCIGFIHQHERVGLNHMFLRSIGNGLSPPNTFFSCDDMAIARFPEPGITRFSTGLLARMWGGAGSFSVQNAHRCFAVAFLFQFLNRRSSTGVMAGHERPNFNWQLSGSVFFW